MTEVDPAGHRRPLPQTTLQFAGHAAENVVSGLSGRSPYMLGIVLLNMLGIAAAIYFLNILIQGQQRHLNALLTQQSTQQTEILTMHKHEFDTLVAMIPRIENQPMAVPTAPATAPPSTAPPARGSAR
jgi:hypothetical protein